MFYDPRPTVFVLAHTDNGAMITSILDWEQTGPGHSVGVAVELFNKSQYEPTEIEFLCALLDLRRGYFGDGAYVIDGGANIGCYTIPIAKHMTGWGKALAIEPQNRLFYALAGNIALNNCLNADTINAALGKETGTITVPFVDYTKPSNLGGVELAKGLGYEVALIAIDSSPLSRLDLLKLDIEGMELDALAGARETLERCKPIIHVEHIKCGEDNLRRMLEPMGYDVQPMGMNLICIHKDDPVSKQVTFKAKEAA